MKKILLLISILACILLNAEIVTRQSIISQTKVYAEYSWKVNTPNPRYAQYKKQGTQITGEAYSYGDKDNTSAFQSDINAGVMPRNWKANHDDGHTTGYTGIDCSGLVTDCWDVSIHGGAALVGLCMELADSSLLKMGDAVRKPGHIQLYAWNDSVYEAVGSDQLDLWDWHKVRLSPATYKNRTFYSIFPQFSSPKPGNGYIVHLEDPNVTEYDIDIELTIRASGDIDNDEFVLKIDDEEIDETDYELIACLSVGYNEYRLDCSHTFEERGLHKVEVKAGNDKSNNIYVDEYEWSFFIGEGYGVFLIEPDFLYIPMGSNKDQKVELLYFPPDYCSTNPSGESYELNYSILGNFVSGWVTPNWSDYQGVIESTGEIKETWQYNIKNESDEEGSKNKITAKAYNDDDYLEVQAIVTSEDPEHAENHPDDAQLIAEGYYPTDRIYNPRSNIGVLLSGAGIGVSHIMGNFNTGICGVIPENFKVSGISGRQLEDLDVLIIGSAGIYVLNNPQLRERLHLWVENGGTVISMTSQFGFEWEYLPIPDGEQLDGYGWDEDQYCSKSSVYIEDRHPIISGQTNKILSMYVDGYIDKYPSNAKIPIKRTASTMPAAIEYQYGEGNVIITSDYVDWGYNHRQYFHDDLVFVRDMLKYGEIAGQYIEEITDYAQNQTNIDIDIKNNTSRTADKCVIKIFSPDNILLDSIIIDDMNLIGGGSYIHSAVINCEVRGIYTIKYILLNENNSIVQKENIYGGIVKYGLLDGGDYAENGLKMWCTSDKDKCILGDSVTVTAHLLNLQDDPFTGKIMIAIHEENGVWFDIVDSLYFENLESNEMVNHIYTFAPRKNTSVETGAYTQDKSYYTSGFKNSITGMIDRGIWIVKGAEIKLQTTVINDTIEPKQNILMERKIINKSDIDVNAKLITDINKLNVNDTKSLLISGLDTIIDTFSYETNVVLETQKINIVSYLTNGLNVNAIESNSVILKSLGFEVLCNAIINESQIGIYNYMKNTSTISINNIINAISLLEGNESILDSVFLLDSLRENEIYEDSIFSDYNDFKFGDYTLINTYILFDDTIIKEKKYLNKILFNFDLEKNTYTLLDTVKFTLCLVNTGDFYISPDLNIDLFAYNFQTNTGMMNPRDTLKYNFEIPLIDYYNASYNNKITLELNGSSITKEINCNVIPAKLFSRIIFDDTVSTGAVIDAKIINQGGLPANFTSTLRIIDSRGIIFDVDSINSSVGVLDSTDISLSLPEFINDDTYQIVLITVYNDKTNYSSKTIKINGISIAGNVYSQNDYYFTDTDKIGKIDFSSNSEIDTLLIDYKITNIGEEERINISGVSNLSNGQFDNTYLSPNYTGIGIAPKYLLDEEFEKRNFHYILKMDIDKKGNIYISDWGGKVFIMDNEGNYLKYMSPL